MREILFKGKLIDRSDWVTGFLVIDKDGTAWIVNNHGAYYTWDEVIPETVSQYVGVSDKNGKKIYEGDIGEIKTQSGRIERFIVKWGIHRRRMHTGWEVDIPGYCFFIDNFASFPIAVNYQNGHDLDIIEIIGNTHDNPELLQSL